MYSKSWIYLLISGTLAYSKFILGLQLKPKLNNFILHLKDTEKLNNTMNTIYIYFKDYTTVVLQKLLIPFTFLVTLWILLLKPLLPPSTLLMLSSPSQQEMSPLAVEVKFSSTELATLVTNPHLDKLNAQIVFAHIQY